MDKPDDGNPERKGQSQEGGDGVWAFASPVQCPNPSCGSFNTVQTSTQPPIQYRRCRRCGCSFKVYGRQIG